MEALLAFAAALLSLRLAGLLARRRREGGPPQLTAWAASLAAYAAASGALAWGAAAGWGDEAFRVYYLFGGLLTAPLLGVGSLLLAGRRWAAPLGLLYTGLAVGVAIAVPLTAPVAGGSIPEAQEHLDFLPARLLAVLGNTLGTLAVVAIAILTIRRRPLGNALIVAGVAVAAAGSGLAGTGVAETAGFVAAAALLLYAGFVIPRHVARSEILGFGQDRPGSQDGTLLVLDLEMQSSGRSPTSAANDANASRSSDSERAPGRRPGACVEKCTS